MNEEQQTPPVSGQRRESLHSPARAALSALVPGLGAVYNRQYQKAVVHFAVFAGLVRLGDASGIFVLASVAFYLFTIIDAYRSAEVIRVRGAERTEEPAGEIQNLPLWGGFLMFIGVLFLLDNVNVIDLEDVLDFWPLIFIAIGGYILYSSYARETSSNGRRGSTSTGITGSGETGEL